MRKQESGFRKGVTMKKCTLIAVTALLAISAAFGQEQHGTSASKIVRLNRAPVSKEILRVTLPRPNEITLPNGLTVMVLERHKLPTLNMALWIKTGALRDPRTLPGLASFTAGMLREGTTHRSSEQIAAAVDDIGATLQASARFGSNLTSITASGLAGDADRILELMSDVVLNPTFPESELAKYKTRQLAALQQQRSEPGFLSQERFHEALYRSFPAAVVSATPESVKAMTPELLRKFHDEYYLPSNAILGVVGDVQENEIIALISKHFGNWNGRPVANTELGELPPPAPFKIYLVDRPDSVQTNIVAGDYGARRTDPDYVALTVMNRILGGGPTGRLFMNLRAEKGYTYGAFSFFGDGIYREPWLAETAVRTAVTDGSMHELMYEFKRIANERVPEQELDEARHAIVANFALSLEQPARLLNDWMLVRYYSLPLDYWDRFPEQVAKISADQVEETARKYVDLDHLQVVCVGDAKQIKQVLQKYGPVEVYDANGNRLN